MVSKKAYVLPTEPFYELHAIQQFTLVEPNYFLLILAFQPSTNRKKYGL